MSSASSGRPSWTLGSSSSQVRHTNEGIVMDNIHVDPRKQELLEARFLGATGRSFPSLVVAAQLQAQTTQQQQQHSQSQQENSNLSSGCASIDRDDASEHLPGAPTPEKGKVPAERKRKRKAAMDAGDAVAVKNTKAETNGKKINEYFKNQSPVRAHQAGAKSPSPQGYPSNYIATSPGSSSNSVADITLTYPARSLSSPSVGAPPAAHKPMQVGYPLMLKD